MIVAASTHHDARLPMSPAFRHISLTRPTRTPACCFRILGMRQSQDTVFQTAAIRAGYWAVSCSYSRGFARQLSCIPRMSHTARTGLPDPTLLTC